MNSLISKARKPKFELNLKIIDLNNVPLVSGSAFVKWHLPASTSAEHRGKTDKAPIKEHKVTWEYEKTLQVRITMDKSNMLMESFIYLEVVQEYNSGIGRPDKIPLGNVSLNLAEYVDIQGEEGDDGTMRRYLMQESKINSTVKIGIVMRQLDGERNYIAPPLKTAPVFGGIAGIMDYEQTEQDDLGHAPAMNRSRENGELQDIYRQALAASWGAHDGEYAADQCVDDIFAGGDGWKQASRPPQAKMAPLDSENESEEQHFYSNGRRLHTRSHSGSSEKSQATVKGNAFRQHKYGKDREHLEMASRGHIRGKKSTSSIGGAQGSSSESSERGRQGFKHANEVDEFVVREDLVAWALPGMVE